MPIEIDPDLPGPEPIPQIAPSDMTGARNVDPDDNPEGGEQPLFRPHAFALTYGEGEAAIAYGQFMWRFDVLQFNFSSSGGTCDGVGQSVIKGWETEVPNLKTHDGNAMEGSPVANKFHGLGAYGNVYLYWFVDTDHADFVTKCWVQVGDVATSDLPAVAPANTIHDRLGVLSANGEETYYRIKIGNVPDPDLNTDIVQNLSSDVYWPFTLMTRNGPAP